MGGWPFSARPCAPPLTPPPSAEADAPTPKLTVAGAPGVTSASGPRPSFSGRVTPRNNVGRKGSSADGRVRPALPSTPGRAIRDTVRACMASFLTGTMGPRKSPRGRLTPPVPALAATRPPETFLLRLARTDDEATAAQLKTDQPRASSAPSKPSPGALTASERARPTTPAAASRRAARPA